MVPYCREEEGRIYYQRLHLHLLFCSSVLSPCLFVIDVCDAILLGPVAELQLVGPSAIVVPVAEIEKDKIINRELSDVYVMKKSN